MSVSLRWPMVMCINCNLVNQLSVTTNTTLDNKTVVFLSFSCKSLTTRRTTLLVNQILILSGQLLSFVSILSWPDGKGVGIL